MSLRSIVATENKYNVICKLMEESVDKPDNHPPHSHHSSKAHSAHSAISAPVKKEESLEVAERSDSEDCCSRAERTQFDENGNKLRYREAQEKVKATKNAKNKKSALPTKNNLKSEEKGPRQVRFSDRSKDRDFM